jgi:hypothetical protein
MLFVQLRIAVRGHRSNADMDHGANRQQTGAMNPADRIANPIRDGIWKAGKQKQMATAWTFRGRLYDTRSGSETGPPGSEFPFLPPLFSKLIPPPLREPFQPVAVGIVQEAEDAGLHDGEVERTWKLFQT